ncbi:unnamed protein product [Ectocarpus sp. 8 AP-2014]
MSWERKPPTKASPAPIGTLYNSGERSQGYGVGGTKRRPSNRPEKRWCESVWGEGKYGGEEMFMILRTTCWLLLERADTTEMHGATSRRALRWEGLLAVALAQHSPKISFLSCSDACNTIP